MAERPACPTCPLKPPGRRERSAPWLSRRRGLLAAVLLTVHVLLATAAIGVALQQRQLEINETRAISDLVRFGEWSRGIASRANQGGFPSPHARAVEGSIPGIEALPRRFASPERGGYRFTFKGFRSSRPRGHRWTVVPAYQAFTFTAVPLEHGKSGRRSFSLQSVTMAVHSREDGRTPGLDDPVIEELQ